MDSSVKGELESSDGDTAAEDSSSINSFMNTRADLVGPTTACFWNFGETPEDEVETETGVDVEVEVAGGAGGVPSGLLMSVVMLLLLLAAAFTAGLITTTVLRELLPLPQERTGYKRRG